SLDEKIEFVKRTYANTLSKTLDITFTFFSPKLVRAHMPVTKKVAQPLGILHGGASVALAEGLASTAGMLNVDISKFNVVGMEINANHISSVPADKGIFIEGEARP